ncbi:MAG: glycoside hydrolase family 30 beta sandwich domain-containing protein [Myxococcota bacterium]
MQAFVTEAGGRRLAPLPVRPVAGGTDVHITVDADTPRQTVHGIGGSLTQASAHAMSALSAARRQEILTALFAPDRAAYSLVRTHVASCDFSTSSYTYAPEPDPSLAGFSIDVDRQNGHLALLKGARAVPGADFRIVASPWTAPPWMKDNGKFYDDTSDPRRGGRLLEEHHETFARYLVKYAQAYRDEGLEPWAFTVVNAPHGIYGTWESMEMEPAQQRDVVEQMRRTFDKHGVDALIFCYDQNRTGAEEFAEGVLASRKARKSVAGIAVHWYDSTFKVYEDELDKLHERFPEHPVLQSEGCIDNVFGKGKDRGPDAPLPWWKDDAWYWRKEATDWGYDWSTKKEDHPKYSPAFRYARDLVGCLAHHVTGWIDWNVVLDKRGGPNHVGNFCLAPILVDGPSDTVYYTPLFTILEQVSRSTRPGAVIHRTDVQAPEHARGHLWAVGLVNPDGKRVVHVFYEGEQALSCRVDHGTESVEVTLPPGSLVTLQSS